MSFGKGGTACLWSPCAPRLALHSVRSCLCTEHMPCMHCQAGCVGSSCFGGYLYFGSYILGALSHSSACIRTRARQLLQFLQQLNARCLAQASPATVLATSGAPVRAYCEALSCWSFRILPVMLRRWCHRVLHKGLYGMSALQNFCTAGVLEGGFFMPDIQLCGIGFMGH